MLLKTIFLQLLTTIRLFISHTYVHKRKVLRLPHHSQTAVLQMFITVVNIYNTKSICILLNKLHDASFWLHSHTFSFPFLSYITFYFNKQLYTIVIVIPFIIKELKFLI